MNNGRASIAAHVYLIALRTCARNQSAPASSTPARRTTDTESFEPANGPDRSWWDIGAIFTFGQFDLDLRWYDTDLDFIECGFSENCDPALVGSLSWNPWRG